MKKRRRYKYKVVDKFSHISSTVVQTSLYCLTYTKGKIVKARGDTLGVLVFKTREQAEHFIKYYNGSYTWTIKRVIPIGRGKVPKILSRQALTECLYKFYEMLDPETKLPPAGTIGYPAVEVVD